MQPWILNQRRTEKRAPKQRHYYSFGSLPPDIWKYMYYEYFGWTLNIRLCVHYEYGDRVPSSPSPPHKTLSIGRKGFEKLNQKGIFQAILLFPIRECICLGAIVCCLVTSVAPRKHVDIYIYWMAGTPLHFKCICHRNFEARNEFVTVLPALF